MATDLHLSQLSQLELRVVEPLSRVAVAVHDTGRSSVELINKVLICRFFSLRDQSCPFELHFGREVNRGRFSFFVGAGAEFCNFEALETPDDSVALAEDVECFLRSTVHCERLRSKHGIARETYVPTEMDGGGMPLKLVYRAISGPRAWLATAERFDYRPWISEPVRM